MEMTRPFIRRFAFASDHFCRVIIWPDLESMRRFVDHLIEKDDRPYFGFFYGRDVVIRVDEGEKVVVSKHIADIHFAYGNMGAGTIAHEVQHLSSYWLFISGWLDDLLGKYWEPISEEIGDFTEEISYWYYDVIQPQMKL